MAIWSHTWTRCCGVVDAPVLQRSLVAAMEALNAAAADAPQARSVAMAILSHTMTWCCRTVELMMEHDELPSRTDWQRKMDGQKKTRRA